MSALHALATRALHGLDPETGHELALSALKAGLGPRARNDRHAILRTTLAGLDLANPIGLAAGFDKNAAVPDALIAAGFGFVECGTVTPRPQAGNPRPRLFRLGEDHAAINRMGFNNEGLGAFAARLGARAPRGLIGANIGANKDSADRVADYVTGLSQVWPHASYVTVNISSPNTPGLRGLQERGALEELLGRLREARAPLTAAHGGRPLFVKIAPDLDASAIGEIVEVAVAFGVDGLIVSNTTIARPESLRSRWRGEAGGLSGRPLLAPSTAALREAARTAQGRLALVGAGGVESGRDALMKLKAGAQAVQLYTALVFHGPGLAAAIGDELARLLAAEGFASVADAVGADLK
jgi:dihydroorotate dehydrogenase